MDRQSMIIRQKEPPKSKAACDISTGVRVMAASGLWRDLQEGLVQAETICNDLLGKHLGTERCAQSYRRNIAGRGYGQSLRATVPAIDLLVWRTSSGVVCGRGGDRI